LRLLHRHFLNNLFRAIVFFFMHSTLPHKLGDRYELLELLGIGGMAEVYRARMFGAEGFAKMVVIKKLLPQFSHEPEIVAQFIGEARLAAMLHHDNIADIYDFGESDAAYYIAMEYLVGRDLYSVQQQVAGTGLGLAPALFVASAICAGMEYAHARSNDQGRPLAIIHRDLSPHNVFITSDGVVKVIDFGVARAELYDHHTRPGMVKGKISYMSPEQLAGEEIDHRSDIFSIGILLYEMLSGQKLYSGDTATLLRKCLSAEYRDVAELVPDLPPAVVAVVRRALAKERELRYQSCGAMGTDLEDCLFAEGSRFGRDGLRQMMTALFPEPHGFSGSKPLALPSRQAAADLEACEQTMAIAIPRNDGGGGAGPSLQGFRRGGRVLPLAFGVSVVVVTFIVVLWLALSGDKAQQTPAAAIPAPATPSLSSAAPPSQVTMGEERRGGDEDETIAALISQAEQALAEKGRDGGEAAALSAYRRILALHPDHHQARLGLAALAQRYGDSTERALQADRLAQAGAHLRRGLEAFPEDPRLLQLQQRIDKQRRLEVGRLTTRAEAALADNRLTTPADDCAFFYYKQIEHLEGRSDTVRRGLEKIADRYAALAEDAYRNLQREKCREYVRQGLAIDPRHRQLLQLQKDLQRSPPGMFFKSLEKSFQPLFTR
jgi:tetratricopeptide (TPR) repeat protein